MKQYNSAHLNAHDESIISRYISKYGAGNTMDFTITNDTVIKSYLTDARKELIANPNDAVIVDFIEFLEDIETRKTVFTDEQNE